MPMMLLMYKVRMFCQIFLSSDTRKLTAKWMLYTGSSSVIFTWPAATARHSTFFIWNLIVDFTSTLATMFSLWVSKEGNVQPYSGLVPGFVGSAGLETLRPKMHHPSCPSF